jgi:hypothetical protein
MPDTWEVEHGLHPGVADNNEDLDSDGYTELEEYLNELAAWPAPGPVVFTGQTNSRYAEIFNWRVTGELVRLAGAGVIRTSSPWQPGRYDLAVVSNTTAVVDAPGQHAGRLQLIGNALVDLTGGWLKVEDQVDIAPGCTLAVHAGGRLAASGIVNRGTLRLTGTADLQISGTSTNYGVVDLTTWEGTLPSGLVNYGTVLDRSAVRITGAAVHGEDVEVGILGLEGHGYRLQYAGPPLHGGWQDVGAATPGAGGPLPLVHDGGAAATTRYYRVLVDP